MNSVSCFKGLFLWMKLGFYEVIARIDFAQKRLF